MHRDHAPATAALGVAVPGPDPATDGRLRIAFISKSYADPFWLDAIDGAQRAAEELGVERLVHSAKDETHVVDQVQIVENMIQLEVDGILLAPCDSNVLSPAVLKVNQAGIPITVVDTGISEGDIVTFAATDNVLCGTMAADRLANRLSARGKVGVIACPPSILPCREILNGFVEGLRKYPDLAGLYIFGGPASLFARTWVSASFIVSAIRYSPRPNSWKKAEKINLKEQP